MGVVTAGGQRADTEDSLDELAQLADTAGADSVATLIQTLHHPHPATYLGSGKVEELAELVEQHAADLVVFDDDLSPNQIRNLEKKIGVKLIDRSALILDIFARRARTSTAKTQVELAQLEYLRTRLTRAWTHLERQKGGIGMRGPGETQIETDRRLIGTRIATLKERLRIIDKQRQTQRQGRAQYVRFSIVGYTNAGKSTLLNALSGTDVLAENRLFATLDSTTRLITLAGNKPVMLSDTVGFIRKLPHGLVESFKSTLDEVRESDILVHVVDATHPRFQDHIAVVRETLRELGAADKPSLLVFNKVDVLQEKDLLHAIRAEYGDALFISGLRGVGLDGLLNRMLEMAEADYVTCEAMLPVAEAALLTHIRRVAEVLHEEYLFARESPEAEPDAAVYVRLRMAPHHHKDLLPQLARFAHWRRLPEEELVAPPVDQVE